MSNWTSTNADIGNWLHGNALQRHHSDAREAPTGVRWHGSNPRNDSLPAVHQSHSKLNQEKTPPAPSPLTGAQPPNGEVRFVHGRALPSASLRATPMPGSSGDAATAYMQLQLPSRIFNVASRGLPSGAQRQWCFERMPSLIPSPLARYWAPVINRPDDAPLEWLQGRSCAGLPARVPSETRRALDRPVLPGIRQVQSESSLHLPQWDEGSLVDRRSSWHFSQE
ncbi:unnamed protein product [Cladocopium goreaui]|uniref:Uncharacterized protein n=1 Tax=Cladocopium goreaui TaxID=2562237 RepID=A0A9P1FFK3_9DINO|nr:unnamed protein product [Cladocopium goreaui]